ncbi:heavy metal-associated isoprenylated plant protein 8-like [Rhododendron vialii]|uniref:heavy metal-associated isoprenylated plant protein 8-like n=1 Tax=Rhododendron vialii TaxID=182163 RepID=UPI00265DEB0F|nr:heavy metal-associated isoprenylated plant protein 8-like [Rhododendron vialii]
MAKRKSKKKQSSTQDQAENLQEQINEGTNEESNKKQNPYGVIVLGVYMHCQGCADTITKYLRGSDGVEQIEIDLKNHKVTVKGKDVDPENVVERLRKKSNKHISLISPILEGRKEEGKEEKKEESNVVEAVLKIYMHCESCAADIKYSIHKMQGVLAVETDMKNSQVIVKGAFDPKKLVDFINRRAGKNAVVVKQTPDKKEDVKGKKGKKTEGEGDQIYPPGLVYAPQIFSEENPNACSVM